MISFQKLEHFLLDFQGIDSFTFLWQAKCTCFVHGPYWNNWIYSHRFIVGEPDTQSGATNGTSDYQFVTMIYIEDSRSISIRDQLSQNNQPTISRYIINTDIQQIHHDYRHIVCICRLLTQSRYIKNHQHKKYIIAIYYDHQRALTAHPMIIQCQNK